MVQDGNGRLNQYWNAYTDAGGYKYIVGSEPSARYLMSINGTTGGVHAWYGAAAGTAGAALTWTQMGQMTSGTGGIIWFSPRGTATDFSIGITGGVSIGNSTDPGATNLSVTGTATAASFSGAGTGLTGTASSLSIGGNAATATTATTANALNTANSYTGAGFTSTAGFTANSTNPFIYNAQTVSANVTIPTNFNATAAGKITINTGIVVTVSTGSRLVIV